MTLKEFVDTNWHRGNVVKEENPAQEAPKKRVRQRIRISATPVREKVEFFKKK